MTLSHELGPGAQAQAAGDFEAGPSLLLLVSLAGLALYRTCPSPLHPASPPRLCLLSSLVPRSQAVITLEKE